MYGTINNRGLSASSISSSHISPRRIASNPK